VGFVHVAWIGNVLTNLTLEEVNYWYDNKLLELFRHSLSLHLIVHMYTSVNNNHALETDLYRPASFFVIFQYLDFMDNSLSSI